MVLDHPCLLDAQPVNIDPHEADYRPAIDPPVSGEFLPGTSIEIIGGAARHGPPAHVIFDFDGTLSLIREGWPEVMVPMMVDVLQATGTCEPAQQLHALCLDFVMQLNGKQTIYQMIRLAEEVGRRGGVPEEPIAYKQMYHERLMQRIAGRREALRSGRVEPRRMLVPGSLEMLDALQQRGARLYLASGTDRQFVVEEARLLGLEPFFGERIFGACDDYLAFSKAMVIQQILTENDVDGAALLGFGDGYVEIQNVKQAGGTAVAVASDESGRSGKPDAWKRRRLLGVGADVVVPDFREWEVLLGYLWNEAV
ncbi:MAG: HAD family hydrolase [Planctomycetes bacterium]|nr:HAD family hydrolase [Planctomycetota bacterium]